MKSSVSRLRNSLFFQIYLYFAIILTVFAVLIGVIFSNLYAKSITSSYEQQLKKQGSNLAKSISSYINNKDLSGYTSFIVSWQEILLIENTDIWVVQNPKNPMDSNFATVNDNVTLTNDMEKVLNSAFKNQFKVVSSYDEIYGKQIMRAATPVWDSGGNVIGAVLLNSFVEGQAQVIHNSQYFILISALVAFLVAFIISYVFARQLSAPITQMRLTALELAKGNYEKKTRIDRKDEIGELASTINVLSEQLAANEIARQEMEQMRMDFFANVSHELRTPITVVRGYTETLLDGIVTKPEKVNQYHERMLNECKSMERLVGDLLTLSKMQNPDFVINKEPVNLIQIFEDILRSAGVIASKKEIHLNLQKQSDCIMLDGDYDRLRQMFLVIVDNAIKFSPENTTITIAVEAEDPLCISIEDQGVGISPEDLPNIFDKFYKSKLRQNATGSGLGLVIAKQIAKKHDGTIQVESTLEKGTKFTFFFDRP